MADRVGFARNINEEYLNAVADCKLADKSEEEAGDILNELIEMNINAETNIRKTRMILLNTWYRNEPWLQDQCVEIARLSTKDERLPLHWALLLAAYPVFFDLCSIIGTTLGYKDEIAAKQIKELVFQAWGARSTLQHSLSKNFQTMKDMRILEQISKAGIYKPIEHTIDDVRIVIVLVITILQCSSLEYSTWEEIVHHPALFPFHIQHVTQADIVTCDRLTLERMGDNVVIRVK